MLQILCNQAHTHLLEKCRTWLIRVLLDVLHNWLHHILEKSLDSSIGIEVWHWPGHAGGPTACINWKFGMLKVNFRYSDLGYPASHRCKIIWNYLLSFQLMRIKTECDKVEFILEKFVVVGIEYLGYLVGQTNRYPCQFRLWKQVCEICCNRKPENKDVWSISICSFKTPEWVCKWIANKKILEHGMLEFCVFASQLVCE